MKKFLFSLAALVALFASCTKESVTPDNSEPKVEKLYNVSFQCTGVESIKINNEPVYNKLSLPLGTYVITWDISDEYQAPISVSANNIISSNDERLSVIINSDETISISATPVPKYEVSLDTSGVDNVIITNDLGVDVGFCVPAGRYRVKWNVKQGFDCTAMTINSSDGAHWYSFGYESMSGIVDIADNCILTIKSAESYIPIYIKCVAFEGADYKLISGMDLSEFLSVVSVIDDKGNTVELSWNGTIDGELITPPSIAKWYHEYGYFGIKNGSLDTSSYSTECKYYVTYLPYGSYSLSTPSSFSWRTLVVGNWHCYDTRYYDKFISIQNVYGYSLMTLGSREQSTFSTDVLKNGMINLDFIFLR